MSQYIHWPFCASKCPYCDFNSHVARNAVDQGRWRDALLKELDYFASQLPGRKLASIFFGGGTPSLMEPETAAALIATAKKLWHHNDPEITLEANPTSVEAGRLREFGGAGVNRLSLGVQSFDDQALKFLGRGHSATEARAALEMATGIFSRTSFDLIYARPGQTPDQWREELTDALAYNAGHLSLYQLSIETGTAFFRDGVASADGDSGAALYELTQGLTEKAGLPAYEISNHARPGQQCRHNVLGWQGHDYAGIGPGAHGRLTVAAKTEALYQIHQPDRWLAAVEKNGHGTAKRSAIDPATRLQEKIMTGLRLTQGIDRETHELFEKGFPNNSLARLIAEDFLVLDENGLRTTATGRLCLDGVLGELLAP
ncbi:MAG TPA: coproporphyrinogen III oxidase [Rhodospirillales bacterium]|nr:coproporphyrinogen III oxidase [Rhodospirillales bacterium]